MDTHTLLERHASVLVAITILLLAARELGASLPLASALRVGAALSLIALGVVAGRAWPCATLTGALAVGAAMFAWWWWNASEFDRRSARERLSRGRDAARKRASAPRQP